MAILPYQGKWPQIAENCFIAASADIIGDVKIGEGSSVWFGVVIRGDVQPVTIGKNTSVQDNTVIHVEEAGLPTIIGDNVTIGHGAIIHACTIENDCMIGMGCVILDGAVIGRGSQVGAAALVPPHKQIPPQSQVMGVPCKITKDLSEAEVQEFVDHAQMYVRNSRKYLEEK